MDLNNRQLAILDMLKVQNSISISEFSSRLFFSASTIRRDLEVLESKNLVRRTHGGAVLVVDRNAEIPHSIRLADNSAAKSVIGKAAAGFVNNGDTIFLDSSTTALYLLPSLMDKTDLTVITNGLKTASALSQYRNIRTICTGGTLRENSLSFIGAHTRSCIDFYYVDKLFFSSRSISAKYGITDINEEEALVRREMLMHCNTAFALADSSKFGTLSRCNVCSCQKADFIITEAPFKESDEWKPFSSKIITAY